VLKHPHCCCLLLLLSLYTQPAPQRATKPHQICIRPRCTTGARFTAVCPKAPAFTIAEWSEYRTRRGMLLSIWSIRQLEFHNLCSSHLKQLACGKEKPLCVVAVHFVSPAAVNAILADTVLCNSLPKLKSGCCQWTCLVSHKLAWRARQVFGLAV
jgi:hypothetical protein